MELTAKMRNSEHGILDSEWQQLRIGSLHLAREFVVLAGLRVHTYDTLAYNNSVDIDVISQNNGLVSLSVSSQCKGRYSITVRLITVLTFFY